ncbi:DUF1217 domain-containing protein [Pseudaestuariivita rosea]|uniref:DUF1217 domain-containing protein n=1 Tax=Pseudaestuariivita rosea TaxID=2763263 RepID=UPI001ABB5B7E|nr:DUF1217 domain-containing protein [Pseudaestuariivita rosea]
MSFTPVLPFSGYSGWLFLERTLETQKNSFVQSPTIERNTKHFAENISSITTAEELMADRQMLEVALGAFGLDEDINNSFFIQKILEDGTSADDALARRLADKRYAEFSDAFGFGSATSPKTQQPGFADQMLEKYQAKQFEIAVGEQNEDMRLALNAEREIEALASDRVSNDAKWFKIMGSPPLRTVFETALGLPSSFSQLDLDQQLESLKDKSEQRFGTSEIADFADKTVTDDLVRQFLVMSEINATRNSTSSGAIALTLLQAASA